MIKILYHNAIGSYLLKPTVFHLTIITLLIALLYKQVYKFDFLIGWDDQWFVLNDYTRDGFTWNNLYDIITDFYYGQYAPVNQLYYTTVYFLFGNNPMWFHIGGVLLHLVNVVLLYFLFIKISKLLFRAPETTYKQVAFVGAILFAVSPFNLEPVAWVAASKVTLYAFFYLVAIDFYQKYILTAGSRYYYLTILFFTISFGAKEQAVTLPFCLILLDYMYKRDFRNNIVWYEKMPFFVLSLFFGIVTIQSQGQAVMESTNFYPVYQRVILAFYTVSEYLTKALVPINLSYLYPFPFQVGSPVPNWLLFYPAAILIVIFCFYRILCKRWVLFGMLFFLIHIVFVVNIFSLARFSIVADRYAYLANAGIYFILGYGFVRLTYESSVRKLVLGIGLVYISYFIFYTHYHLAVWTNVTTLKEKISDTIKERPDYQLWKEKQ